MRLVYWVASLLLVGLLSLHTLPYVARDLIVYSLLQQGADEAKLRVVNIDWLNAKVALRDLVVQHQAASVLRVERLDFDIYLKELLDDRLRLSGLRLEGADLQLRQQDQLILLGPIVLAGQAGQQPESAGDIGYEFGSDLIELVDFNIELLQPQGAQQLNIERLNVGGLYQWSPLESTDIRFVGHINGAPITIDSSALPLPERKTVSVDIALRQLDLTPLLTTLEPQMAASLDANLSIEVAVEGFNAWISQTGTLALNDVAVRTDEAEIGVSSLIWQGEAQQQLDLADGAQLLKELGLKGVLRAEAVQLSQAAQSASFGVIELQPDLRFTPAQQALYGALGVSLNNSDLRNADAGIQLTAVKLDAPAINSGEPLRVDLSVEGIAASDGEGLRLTLEKLAGALRLSAEAGAPVWTPAAAAGELSLGEFRFQSPDLEAQLSQLDLIADSSSINQLENVMLKATSEVIEINAGELQGQLEQLDLALDYVAHQEQLEFRIDLSQPDIQQADVGLSARQISTEFDGRLPADLSELEAQLAIDASGLQLRQAEDRYEVAALTLQGPIKSQLPSPQTPLGAQLLDTAAINLNLQGLNANGASLSGTLKQLGMQSQYEQSSGLLGLKLDVTEADLKAGELAAKTDAYALGVAGTLTDEFSLFSGDLSLQSTGLRLQQSAVDLKWKSLEFKGPLQLALVQDSTALPFALSGSLNLQQLALMNQPQTSLSVGQLSGDLSILQQETLALSAGLNLQQFSLSDGSQQIEIDAVRLDPQLKFSQTLAVLDPQSLNGSLSTTLEGFGLNSSTADVSLAKLSADLNVSSAGEQQRISGAIAGSNIAVQQSELSVSLESIKLQPDMQRSADGISLSTPINLVQALYQDQQQQAQLDRLETDLKLQLDPTGTLSSATLGSTTLGPVAFTGEQPVKLQQATLQSFSLGSKQQIGVKQLQLSDLQVGATEAPMLALQRFELDRAEFADNFLQLGTLVTEDLLANLQSQLKAAPAEPANRSSSNPEEAEQVSVDSSAKEKHLPVDIKLDGWQAQGRSELSYLDTSLAAPLNLKLVASQISAGAWDSRSGDVLPLKLRAKLNDSADISIDANITPLLTKPNGDWKLSVSSLPMPILSPLVQSFAGYQIRSGSLNLDSSGTLKAGQLKGNNAVRIQRLEVQRGEGSTASETDETFTMPLPSAIAILENDERVIKLDLPVSGDINDPKFNYQDVIQIVVTKGVKEGAMAYLTNSLQPFGAIFMVYNAVKDANESGRFIQLQALEFDSTELALNQSGRDYAAKLAGMMQERPSLTLEICPITTTDEEGLLWDRLVEENRAAESPLPELELGDLWSQRIAELAAGRIESLRSALIRVGVANERIFPCIARSGVAEGSPRVELAF